MGRRVALVIGTAHYKDERIDNLGTSHSDARELASCLLATQIGGFADVRELLDPSDQELRGALLEFGGDSSRDDLRLIFFSGQVMPDADGDLYLPGADATASELPRNSMSAEKLFEILGDCTCPRSLLVADLCATRLDGAEPRELRRQLADYAKTADVSLLGVWREIEIGADFPEALRPRHSLLGRALLDAFGGGADVAGKRQVMLGDLSDYLERRIADESMEHVAVFNVPASHCGWAVSASENKSDVSMLAQLSTVPARPLAIDEASRSAPTTAVINQLETVPASPRARAVSDGFSSIPNLEHSIAAAPAVSRALPILAAVGMALALLGLYLVESTLQISPVPSTRPAEPQVDSTGKEGVVATPAKVPATAPAAQLSQAPDWLAVSRLLKQADSLSQVDPAEAEKRYRAALTAADALELLPEEMTQRLDAARSSLAEGKIPSLPRTP